MKLIDVHCHLEHSWFKDVKDVVERARKEGVQVIVTSGFDKKTNRKALEIAEKYGIQASLGIYPKDVLKNEYSEINERFRYF